jgi:hypothetical protein
VGFVHPLHVIVDLSGRLANLLNLLPNSLSENRVLGAAGTCSPGQGVYPFLEVVNELSRQLAPGRNTGDGLCARGCRFGLVTTSVAARGAGLGGSVGVFSGPAGVGIARFGI